MKCSREPGGRKLCTGYVHSLFRTKREDVTCSSPQRCSTASKKPPHLHLRLYNLLRLFSRSIPVHTTNLFMHYYRPRGAIIIIRSLLLQFILQFYFFQGISFLRYISFLYKQYRQYFFMKFCKNRYRFVNNKNSENYFLKLKYIIYII